MEVLKAQAQKTEGYASNMFSSCHIECLTLIWSIKYRLIIKLTVQIETNLRDESIKSN